MPGTVLSEWQVLTCLILTTLLWRIIMVVSLYYRWDKWGTERLSNLPKATQLVNGRARILTQVAASRLHILTHLWQIDSFCSEEQKLSANWQPHIIYCFPIAKKMRGRHIKYIRYTWGTETLSSFSDDDGEKVAESHSPSPILTSWWFIFLPCSQSIHHLGKNGFF